MNPVASICLCGINEIKVQNKMKSYNQIESLKPCYLFSVNPISFSVCFGVTTQIILKYRPNEVGFYLLWRHKESFLGFQTFSLFFGHQIPKVVLAEGENAVCEWCVCLAEDVNQMWSPLSLAWCHILPRIDKTTVLSHPAPELSLS